MLGLSVVFILLLVAIALAPPEVTQVVLVGVWALLAVIAVASLLFAT